MVTFCSLILHIKDIVSYIFIQIIHCNTIDIAPNGYDYANIKLIEKHPWFFNIHVWNLHIKHDQ